MIVFLFIVASDELPPSNVIPNPVYENETPENQLSVGNTGNN